MKKTIKVFEALRSRVAMRSIATQSLRLCTIALIAVMGFSMTACATNNQGTSPVTLTWTEVRPFGVPEPDARQDDNNIFWSVYYGGGKFFAVRNNDNRLMYSEDGITWTEITPSPFNNGRAAIAYGGGTFVAGRYLDMVYSADGITWTKSAFNENAGILSLAYGDGKFVLGSDWGRLYLSTDGITWTRTESAFEVHRAIAYGGGKFVAVGNTQDWSNGESMTPGVIAYSADGGVTWEYSADIAWNRADEVWSITEQSIFDETMVFDVAYGGGKFVAVGGEQTWGSKYENPARMAYSTDGVTWTAIKQSIFGEEDSIRAIAYGGGKFVVVGFRRNNMSNATMAYSTDGITWTEVEDIPTSNRGIFDIAYGGGRFVIVLGEDKIAYSNMQE